MNFKTFRSAFARVALCASMSLAAPAFAQDNPTAQAPQWAVGDSWVFHYYNEVEGAQESTRTETVTAVSAGAPTYEAKIHHVVGNSDGSYEHITDADGNELKNNGYIFGGGHKVLSFPLYVGKEWDSDYTRGDGSAAPAMVKTHVKVVGYGTVHTDAGDFQAFKIEASGDFQMNMATNGAMSKQKEVMWYAPAAKRLVKYTFTRPAMFRESAVAWHLDLVKMNVSEAARAQ